MNRVFLLTATLLPLLTAGPASGKNSQPSNWSRVPPEVRKQLHMSADQVPPYPEDDRRLMSVRWWPKTREFDGQEYVLEYSAWRSDVVRASLRSLSEIDSGWVYGARYVRSQGGKRRSFRGPYYEWYPDSTLYQRSFFTATSSWRSWYYDLRGNLRVYMVSLKGSGCEPGRSSTESFGTDGSLVMCELGRPRKYYRMGTELGREEYHRLLSKFWRWDWSH